MEWGVDDTVDYFKLIKTVEFTVPANYCGWCEANFDTELIEKDQYNDDARYAIELSDVENVFWSVNNNHFDFCRTGERIGDDSEYKTRYNVFAFNIVPTPTYGDPENIIDGVARRWSTNPVHMWIPKKKENQSITLSWDAPQKFNNVNITFDSLSRAYTLMPFDCNKRVSERLVKKYSVEAFINDEWKIIAEKDDNYHRFNMLEFDTVIADKLRVNILETWGEKSGVYEIRVYNN